MVYEACGAMLANARHRDLRDTLRSSRTSRAISVSRWLGSSLRPPQPSAVTGPGLSRTSPGHRFRVANHSSSALPDRFPLLRSDRTVAGSLAVLVEPSRSSVRTPGPFLSWGSLLFAPPPTHPARVHSRRIGLPRCTFGPTAPPVQPRSALVVSHHLDGFLRAQARGLVASRCRSWGSSAFR